MALPDQVKAGIRDAGFTHCTLIQDNVLPLTLVGRDMAAQAQTGTGKTAAFLITLFTKLLASTPRRALAGAPRSLIIAPTRELAVQIAHDANSLGAHTDFVIHVVYGGLDYRKQRDALQRGVDVLIGTPGRLIDYFKQHVYTLRAVEVLVIDEADRMFDMGFIRDLRFLLRRLPPYTQRQSMLFSATLSYAVIELAYEHMNDPVHVSVSPEQITAEKIEHLIYHVGSKEKLSLLVGLLRSKAGERVLIFANMRRTAERLVTALEASGICAAPITGDVQQRRRLEILARFKAGDLRVLVATDVASRGLHIEGVTDVINYDLPQDPQDYVHRTGRTARAGARGKALSLVSEDDVDALDPIEQLIGFKLPFVVPEDELFAPAVDAASRPRGRRLGSGGAGSDRGVRRRTQRHSPSGQGSRARTLSHADGRPTSAHAGNADRGQHPQAPQERRRRQRRRRRGSRGAPKPPPKR
jgi:ATP-dependent RNA helicase RhlB